MIEPPQEPIVDSPLGKQIGFSLIELMITLVIFAMLTLAAVSLGSSWVISSDLQKSESVLKMAHAKAKSLAIRNSGGNAAGLQITGQKVFVCQGNITGGCNASNAVWSASFAKNSTIAVNATEDLGIQLNRNGLSTQPLTYSISKGGDSVDGSLV
jgi:prepilin-type N-terminal cleavage/methylation domain-containing protein